MYLYIKAIHIIFIVTWFSGLFYIVRLFIYHRESEDAAKEARVILQPQYELMMKRLWLGITWPSAIITAILGCSLVSYYKPIPTWLWWKLGFVLLLFAYHFSLHYIFKKQVAKKFPLSSHQLRIWNEVATVFLTAIVFLVVIKQLLSLLWAVVGLASLIGILLVAIYCYKVYRQAQTH